MARSRSRSYRPPDVWPGYVDALTTLLLSITFLLTVYVLAQFFLSQTLSGREKALQSLRQDVAALSQQLAGEHKAKQDAEAQAAGLTASLRSATESREAVEKRAAGLQEDIERLNTQLAQIAAALEEGRKTLTAFARTLIEIAGKITPDVSWVLRVDGHTDRVPIASARFPSNWELSAGRALSVVKFLTSKGVPPQRLAATGFGEFQPLDDGTGAAANARNRRIEMRLTDR